MLSFSLFYFSLDTDPLLVFLEIGPSPLNGISTYQIERDKVLAGNLSALPERVSLFSGSHYFGPGSHKFF
jgi:hypothetical protein